MQGKGGMCSLTVFIVSCVSKFLMLIFSLLYGFLAFKTVRRHHHSNRHRNSADNVLLHYGPSDRMYAALYCRTLAIHVYASQTDQPKPDTDHSTVLHQTAQLHAGDESDCPVACSSKHAPYLHCRSFCLGYDTDDYQLLQQAYTETLLPFTSDSSMLLGFR